MSCQANDGNVGEKLYQISTIQALTAGDYFKNLELTKVSKESVDKVEMGK